MCLPTPRGYCTERTGGVEEFIEQIEAASPTGRKNIHAIVDSCATDKHGAAEEWVAEHDRWFFHSAPTSCSWQNAVEGSFGKLARRRLRRGVHDSIEQLENAVLDFIELRNGKEAKPYR